MSLSTASLKAPKRCFLCEVPPRPMTTTKDVYRIQGRLVGISQDYHSAVTLDDGTGLFTFQLENSMLERLRKRKKVHAGDLWECLINSSSSDEEEHDLPVWHAQSVAVLPDSAAETLRWFELANRQNSDFDFSWGYPAEHDKTLVKAVLQTEKAAGGVSLADLKNCVMDGEKLIQECQDEALCYRNEQGKYLPL